MTDLERICAIGWDVGDDGCWYWRGELADGRRAKINVSKGNRNTARVLWELLNGPVSPATLEVCHTCNNPPCINPAHLKLGTKAENRADYDKVRVPRKPKLSENDAKRARLILETGLLTKREIARAFMVGEQTIAKVLR